MGESAPTQRAVVISGASSGIGRATALFLDGLGYRVYAGVRSDEDARQLASAATALLQPLHLDVRDGESIAAVARSVAESLGDDRFVGVVNNAGVNHLGPLEFLSLELLRDQLEVNVVGQLALCQAFLPLLRRFGGRVINVSSVSGFLALPLIGAYAASKHALEAMSDSLRRELRPWGLHVSVIQPEAIATRIWDRAEGQIRAASKSLPAEGRQLYGASLERFLKVNQETAQAALPPERVAEVVHRALIARRPRRRYRVGRAATMLHVLSRVLPDRVLDHLVAKMLGA